MHSYHLFLANVLVYAIWIVSNSSMLISWGVRFSGFCPCIRGDAGTNFIGLDLYLSTDTGAQFSGLWDADGVAYLFFNWCLDMFL